jgi:hypothetical protein
LIGGLGVAERALVPMSSLADHGVGALPPGMRDIGRQHPAQLWTEIFAQTRWNRASISKSYRV